MIKAKDPRVAEVTKIRLNGMARVHGEWAPIDCYSYEEYHQEFFKVVAERELVGINLPKARWHDDRQYQHLSRQYQKAIDHYLAIHGTVLPYPELGIQRGTAHAVDMQSYLGEIAQREGYSGWQDYHDWYVDTVLASEPERGMPAGSHYYWPVILSEFEDEGLQDGSHRLHQYMLQDAQNIPFIMFQNEPRKIRRVVEAWALRARKVQSIQREWELA